MWDLCYFRRMKHKKYLRKQVEGDDSENVSDDREDDEPGLKYIKKEDIKHPDEGEPSSLGHHGEWVLNFDTLYFIFNIPSNYH